MFLVHVEVLFKTQDLVDEASIKGLASLLKYKTNLRGALMTGLVEVEEMIIHPGTMTNATTSTTFFMVAELLGILPTA